MTSKSTSVASDDMDGRRETPAMSQGWNLWSPALFWDLIQFGAPVVFAICIVFIGNFSVFWFDALNFGDWAGALGLNTRPVTPEGGAKLMSWVASIPLFYVMISVLSAATHPSGQYWKSTVDAALSVVPALALIAIVVLHNFAELPLDVYQRKFLWYCAVAVFLDVVACNIIARRIGMQWGIGK